MRPLNLLRTHFNGTLIVKKSFVRIGLMTMFRECSKKKVIFPNDVSLFTLTLGQKKQKEHFKRITEAFNKQVASVVSAS